MVEHENPFRIRCGGFDGFGRARADAGEGWEVRLRDRDCVGMAVSGIRVVWGASLQSSTARPGRRFRSGWKPIRRDLGIAGGFLLGSNIVLALLGRLLRATPNQAIRNLLPHGGFEVALYLVLALTAEICEEIIFRGYLQR